MKLPAGLAQLQAWARRLQTNIITVVASLASVAVGAVFCWLAEPDTFWPAFSLAIGAGIIAAGTLGLVSQLFVQRSVQREFLQAASLSSELAIAGLERIMTSTKQFETDFGALLRVGSVVDLSFIDNQRWLSQHADSLRGLLKRNGRIRVMMPLESDAATMSELFKRIDDTDRDRFKTRVKATRDLIEDLKTQYPPQFDDRGRFQSGLWFKSSRVAPTYSLYRIDSTAVMRVFEVQKKDTPTHPVLVLRSEGTLWNFVRSDFDAVFNASE